MLREKKMLKYDILINLIITKKNIKKIRKNQPFLKLCKNNICNLYVNFFQNIFIEVYLIIQIII